MQNMRRVCLCLLTLMLLTLPLSSLAEGGSKLQMQVTLGYDGAITYGKTIPVTVEIENAGPDLAATLTLDVYASRTEYNRYEQELTLASGAAKKLVLPIRIGSQQKQFTVELRRGEQVLLSQQLSPAQVISPAAALVGVLSDQPQALSYLTINRDNDELIRGEYWQTVPLTAENFPDSLRLMNAFSALVVDGFDVSSLSPAQQETLIAWLEKGRLVLLGGGGKGVIGSSFFADHYGLAIGGAETGTDVTPALLRALDLIGEPAGEQGLLSPLFGGETVIAVEEQPVVCRAQAGYGRIYATAFSLSEDPFRSWAYAHTFFQRLLLAKDPDFYNQLMYVNEDNYSSLSYLTDSIPLANPGTLTLALLAAALLPVGAGLCYLALKKKDRRQLLWLAVPLLAAGCTGAVAGLSGATALNQPVALRIAALRQNENGVWRMETVVSVATPEKGMHQLSADQGTLMPMDSNYYDYYYDDSRLPSTPNQLRYLFTGGSRSAISAGFRSPWSVQNFELTAEDGAVSGVDGRVWMEPDGAHGTLINQTGQDLSAGLVLCPYGYCSVPALKAGDSYDFVLKQGQVKDSKNPKYEDGVLYESLFRMGNYNDFLSAYFYPDGEKELSGSEKTERELRYSLANNVVGNQSGRSAGAIGWRDGSLGFYYISFCDALAQTHPLLIDGQEITRGGSRGVVSALLPFTGVSPDGLVYHLPGQDAAVRCQLQADGTPSAEPLEGSGQRSFHELSERPVFCFSLDVENVQISRLSIQAETWSSSVSLHLFNGREWVEQPLNEEIPDPRRYINAQGQLFVQLRGTGSEYYVQTPTLMLEGRVK